MGRAGAGRALADGTLRWGELRREVDGISEKMLAATLRTFEADGLVHREAYPEIPPRVEYSLTARGRELCEAMAPLLTWVVANADAVLAGLSAGQVGPDWAPSVRRAAAPP